MEKLMFLRWQAAVKDLKTVRDPIEAGFFAAQAEVETKAAEMLPKDPVRAKKFLTDLTVGRMEQIVKMFRELRLKLLMKYSGDIV